MIDPGSDYGTLFVVATPIGNLGDLSIRAREVLGEVDIVAAEDTRVTRRLLSHFGIAARLTSVHEHNEAGAVESLLAALQDGKSVALVSDSGTPLISDPGYKLVARCRDAGIPVSPLPGASAATAALSVSGLPTDRYTFEGFLPAKAAARETRLASLAGEIRTMVFFESVHRIKDCIDAMRTAFGDSRSAFLGRELSKRHEQCVTATLGALATRLDDGEIPLRGEFVIVVAGEPDPPASTTDSDRLLVELIPLLPGKQAVEIAARVTGENRNRLYKAMLSIRDRD